MAANGVQSLWDTTAGLLDRLIALNATGRRSMGEMANILSGEFNITITRNAVISKLRRIGKHVPTGKKGRKKAKPISKAKAKPAAPAKPKVKAPRQNEVHFVYTPPPAEVPVIGLGLPLVELHEGLCKYPTNAPDAPYAFCGLAIAGDGPYCAGHSRLAYSAPKPRIRNTPIRRGRYQ